MTMMMFLSNIYDEIMSVYVIKSYLEKKKNENRVEKK